MEIASGSTTPALALPCQASVDSILDYEQYVILSTGNFLCSAPTVNSTMDFSVKPIEEGVVDSPPNTKLCMLISCSPSPLRSMHRRALSMSPDSINKGTQRKLYGEETIPITTAATTSNANQTGLPLPTTTPAVAPTRRRVLSSQQGRFKRPKQSVHSLRLPQIQAMTLVKIGHWKCKSNNNCVNTWSRFIREDTAVDQRS